MLEAQQLQAAAMGSEAAEPETGAQAAEDNLPAVSSRGRGRGRGRGSRGGR